MLFWFKHCSHINATAKLLAFASPGTVAAGAGAHAEGLPGGGPGGPECTKGNLPGEAAALRACTAGVSAAACRLGAQAWLPGQL